ncbi:AAA family ATPase [Streptomyces roseolilacinus]|uniref:Nuclease SbcCD subunit C n=1 Tax=Streptomyces roseolilacinus TaxID=66904 RepID=A0A918EMV1_9ACTN|nr:SMC family ATPase [Streptomyces roseolilacinus]GGQ26723.1 nuclease SbcCD subunit C [Streptomyces roseolilacinus]
MRLHRLRVTGFGPFGTAQEIDFDALSAAGLFLLHGPTGAGKTSVLDAVCFALYGSVPGARQAPGAPLRSDHAPADTVTEVVLDLTVAGRRLEVTRRPAQPRPKRRGRGFTTEKAQSWLREYDPATGTWNGLSRSHQEIGEEVAQLVGMSRDQFCQVVLLPQGDFSRFLRSDAEARGRLLGRLFGTRRFAAVEERLAELRRAAEQRVREGDQRLLALAHRMAQAAGDAAGDWPAPDGAPGDPGLTEAVLGWAAVARSGAREALDTAGLALAAAEARQAAARRALDERRDLAALRERYEDARRRAAALEEGRAGHDARRARLDEARAAERVAGPLALRDEAERGHRAAGTARDRTRAALPADLADAGAEALARLAQTRRQELGGLDSARRAEQRLAEIARERADLDRQARADDHSLQDAADWPAGWDAARRALLDRVDAAREAATRAEHLLGRLAPARRRLAAARRRDALARDAAAAEVRLAAARERANTAHETWLDLRERRLRGIAAELAAHLEDGAPCAVCGSAEHPSPARPTADHVDRAAEAGAYEAHTHAAEARTTAERDLAVVREALAAAAAEAAARPSPDAGEDDGAGTGEDHGADTHGPDGDGPAGPAVAALEDLVARLEREHAEARDLAADSHPAREALERAEREHTRRVEERRQAEVRAAARASRRETLDQEQAAREADLARALGDGGGTVARRAAALEREAAALDAAADAVRDAEAAARRLKEADDRLADAAYRAGFATPAAAAAALLDDAARRDLQRRVDAWQAEAAVVADRLAEPAARAAAEGPPADVAAAVAAHDAAERAARAAATTLAAHRDRCAELDRLSARAADEVRTLGPLRAEYDRVARLATLTAGTSAENERRMRLESYVLAARLEQVAAAATARLQRMSSGRYTLVHSDARSGGKRAGLGLHVVDAWTGGERDTATLSGGETFFASLALALGLADVVTDEAGGVRLDTLFIDEGFGSLDEQTLDEVLDVLDSLRERDRSVGIVSHVPDLRRRIPTQLEVVKGRDGSRVRLRAGEGISG